MKWLLVVAFIGCLAQLDASKIVRRTSSSEVPAGNAFFNNNGGNSGNMDATLGAAGTEGGFDNDANDGGGDTPDTNDGGAMGGRRSGMGAAAGGGYGYGNDGGGDTPDGQDRGDGGGARVNGGGQGGGRPVLKNSHFNTVGQGENAGVPDDGEAEAADPGQIVGASSNAGATAGIVVGVVALVGVAAGVAVYVIKKRH